MMNDKKLTEKTREHLNVLCSQITERRVGGQGNRQATGFVKNYFQKAGWNTEETPLQVMDWKTGGATLTGNGQSFEVFSSPYSLGCNVSGKLVAVESIDQLQSISMEGRIVLLHREIASEQIMPKNFVFYNPDHHQRIVSLLEKGNPKAILCATERNAATAGGVYPFPMFEDGDFDIPSVFMKDTEGVKLLACNGSTVHLESQAERLPEVAYNVVARKGEVNSQRIVITAHIDAKIGTPGAIDNATGVTVLLLLADLLKDYSGKHCIELVAFNGEDYYAVPGQMKYIEQNQGAFGNICLNLNIDGAGYKDGPSCFSAFGLPANIQNMLDQVLKYHPAIVEGKPWVQGDHSIFVQYGCPAIAVSSNWFIENMDIQDITHTPKDNLDIVNPERVGECAIAVGELINKLEQENS
ncbi:MAG: DUF4910 domain-containing protein [Prolixibacteraceae bacterium]